MALRAALSAALLAVTLAGGARAQPSDPAPPTVDAATEQARAHFKTGTKLYRDGNYAGALAEFEAAYALKPGPGSLQNIALSQKALFRYGEAADSLTRLLLRHETELSAAEIAAARVARDELKTLVGSIRLVVTPPDARVTLDGQPLTAAERASSLRVNVGEHVIVAEAPGYARFSRAIRVAGGQQDLPVSVALEPVLGFVDVRASDPGAAIAIDGKPLALGHYLGPVTPVEDHLIQVYKTGHQPFETRVRVEVGQTLVVSGKLGKRDAGATVLPPTAPGVLPPPPEPKPSTGWYGLVALNVQATGVAPFQLNLDHARSRAGAIGLRGGHRLRANVAVEGLAELGSHSVDDACDPPPEDSTAPDPVCGLHYAIRWARIGPAVRIMSSADRLRVAGGVGAGVVWHQLNLHPGQEPGVDPFVLLEIGVAANWRRFVFGLDLFLLIDGTRGINDNQRNGTEAFAGRALSFIGLGVRGGFSEWGSPF